jgi:hypothetical protein
MYRLVQCLRVVCPRHLWPLGTRIREAGLRGRRRKLWRRKDPSWCWVKDEERAEEIQRIELMSSLPRDLSHLISYVT